MYSVSQLAKKYVRYYLSAANGKGHGIHSPFVFDFIIHVLNDKKKYPCYEKIEAIRKELLANKELIEVEDFGAGSAVIPFKSRVVKDIAASSLKKKKFAQLLFRMAGYFGSQNILEIGTSFGITASYLASANPNARVYTFEGAKNIAKIARANFDKLGMQNVELIEGNFDETLALNDQKLPQIDLLFVDGNHRKEPTLKYFDFFLSKRTNKSIFVFDDIHWSEEMEEAWTSIKDHPDVTLTIDLFFIGLVFFSKDFKVKQHFVIRF